MKALRTIGWVLGLALVVSGCRRPIGAPLPTGTTCRRNNASVTLGPGDRFTIHVYGQDSLSSEYRVNEDGTIDFPYLNTIHVEDMTAPAVAHLITDGLGPSGHQVLRDPRVSVAIVEVTSRRVSVFGQVQHPGVFPHQQCLTITQVISLAGGFTALAEKNQVRVTRRPRETASADAGVEVSADPTGATGPARQANRPDAGAASSRPRTFVLRVEDIAEGRAPDFDLEAGDVIFVPESIT